MVEEKIQYTSTVHCDKVAQPIGNYRLGKLVKSADGRSTWLYTSGNIGLQPDGSMVSDEMHLQARQSLWNLKTVAESSGFAITDCIKTTVYLVDMADFKEMDVEYCKVFFGEDPPPRVCIAAH